MCVMKSSIQSRIGSLPFSLGATDTECATTLENYSEIASTEVNTKINDDTAMVPWKIWSHQPHFEALVENK